MPNEPEAPKCNFRLDGVVRTQEASLLEEATLQTTLGFVGRLQKFGGNGRFNRQVRRNWQLVLCAALFGAALLLLTACSGDTDSAGGTSEPQSASGTDEPNDSNRAESTVPIFQACQPPDMENCYGYEDMEAYLNQIIPTVEQFFDTAYTDMPRPTQYIYVPEGVTGSGACTGDYTDESYEYCPADAMIHTGQRALWKFYSEAGDAAPAVGLAHEWGHHVQNVVGVPPAETSVGQISRENQADCIAGAWLAYADEQGWLNYPDDVGDTDTLLQMIAETEPGREHGDLGERTDSFVLGIESGLQGCNDFFPDSPVISAWSY